MRKLEFVPFPNTDVDLSVNFFNVLSDSVWPFVET